MRKSAYCCSKTMMPRWSGQHKGTTESGQEDADETRQQDNNNGSDNLHTDKTDHHRRRRPRRRVYL